jgi:hypothetical protein
MMRKKTPLKKSSAAQAAEPAPHKPPARSAIPQVLTELEAGCKQVGVKLTYEAIGGELGSGGLCKVRGEWRAIFDKRTTPAERVALLLPLLARFPLDETTLSQATRELLSKFRPSATPATEEPLQAAG